MKTISIYNICLILLFTIFCVAPSAKGKKAINSGSYFPVNNSITLIYNSTFGESVTRYFKEGEFTVSSSTADNFEYKQTLIVKDDGVYVEEIYQLFELFLFIEKEATFTFEKPLLRFPLPLLPGMKWMWEGEEYSDGDTNRVKVTGEAFEKGFIITKAGRFEAIKLESIVEGSSNTKNRVTEWFAEGIGLIKIKIEIEGGGIMGFLRDLLGYGTIEFELKEIREQ